MPAQVAATDSAVGLRTQNWLSMISQPIPEWQFESSGVVISVQASVQVPAMGAEYEQPLPVVQVLCDEDTSTPATKAQPELALVQDAEVTGAATAMHASWHEAGTPVVMGVYMHPRSMVHFVELVSPAQLANRPTATVLRAQLPPHWSPPVAVTKAGLRVQASGKCAQPKRSRQAPMPADTSMSLQAPSCPCPKLLIVCATEAGARAHVGAT